MASISRLPQEKKDAIAKMGFGGLIHMACVELRHELCQWIISNYDIVYHRINLANGRSYDVTPEDVSVIMGIPSSGQNVVVHNRRATYRRLYNLSIVEDNLTSMPVGDEFRKSFIIFSCATISAPNSKP